MSAERTCRGGCGTSDDLVDDPRGPAHDIPQSACERCLRAELEVDLRPITLTYPALLTRYGALAQGAYVEPVRHAAFQVAGVMGKFDGAHPIAMWWWRKCLADALAFAEDATERASHGDFTIAAPGWLHTAVLEGEACVLYGSFAHMAERRDIRNIRKHVARVTLIERLMVEVEEAEEAILREREVVA